MHQVPPNDTIEVHGADQIEVLHQQYDELHRLFVISLSATQSVKRRAESAEAELAKALGELAEREKLWQDDRDEPTVNRPEHPATGAVAHPSLRGVPAVPR